MLKAPFPWFGGKSTVSDIIWKAFGSVTNYVEPFFGSGAVLLGRPDFTGPETVNDLDGFVSNFWRATQHDPVETAKWADWPVNECDLHARHAWLVSQRQTLTERLMGDPDFYDAKIAGYWVWGVCSWIGSGWCSGKGPWQVSDGKLVDTRDTHLGTAGRGINRQPEGGAGRSEYILSTLSGLSGRLRDVRVCCGDWTRVIGEGATTVHGGITGVFLDPPYADTAGRTEGLYAVDSSTVAHAVKEWAIENGDKARVRIALCGYEGEHEMPDSWVCFKWRARGGYASGMGTTGRENAGKERVWLSPSCLRVTEDTQPSLFRDEEQF